MELRGQGGGGGEATGIVWVWRICGREGGREGEKEGREGRRGGREGGEGGKEGGREGGREGRGKREEGGRRQRVKGDEGAVNRWAWTHAWQSTAIQLYRYDIVFLGILSHDHGQLVLLLLLLLLTLSSGVARRGDGVPSGWAHCGVCITTCAVNWGGEEGGAGGETGR